jgi:ubiquinone/menaquinone biosynthesis C-methylase UbiE
MKKKRSDRYKNIKSKREYVSYYQEREIAKNYIHRDLYGANPLLTNVETRIVLKTFKRLLDCKKCRLLDLASGPGRIVQRLESHFAFSVGVDTSFFMLKNQKNKTKRVRKVLADVELLPFQEEQFDLITGFKFLVNLPQENRTAIYIEAKRVLKENGIIAFNYHLNSLSLRGMRDILLGYRSSSKVISPFSAKREVEKVGFKILGIFGVNMIVFFRLFSFLPSNFLIKIDSFLGRVFPLNLFSDTFIVVARKT